eukprot:956452-Rhodomonas_salina.1
MVSAPRWKDNPLRKLEPKDGVLVNREDWTTWTLPSIDKFDVMEFSLFIEASENLILVNDKFYYFVAHPTPDVLTDVPFKKAVSTYCTAYGMFFTPAAQNVNPASSANFAANYNQ